MDINIVNPTSKEEVDELFSFVKNILNLQGDHPRDLDFYQNVFEQNPEYLLMTKNEDQIIGALLASEDRDDEKTLLVGELAVDRSARGKGVGTLLLKKIEEIAKKHNKKSILLGAVGTAEHFYVRSGYTPQLFVQIKGDNRLDTLKRIYNQNVVWEYSGEGYSKMIIETNNIDKDLQQKFTDKQSVITQYIFVKNI